jgi:hypothetical protein
VWDEIHTHNTFAKSRFHSATFTTAVEDDDDVVAVLNMPTEQRLFYKTISGVHTSISTHIATGEIGSAPRSIDPPRDTCFHIPAHALCIPSP